MSFRSVLPIAALLVAVTASLSAAQGEKGKCIVSGKEIAITEKTPRVFVQGKVHYFCCENCPKAFARSPEKFVKSVGECPVLGGVVMPSATQRVVVNNGLWYVCCPGCNDGVANSTAVLKELTDVVSGKKFKAGAASPRVDHNGQVYYFQSPDTKAAFEKDPAKYAVVYAK